MYNINLLKWYVKVGETYFFFFTKSKERNTKRFRTFIYSAELRKKTCSNNQHSIDLFAIYVVEREKRSTVDV